MSEESKVLDPAISEAGERKTPMRAFKRAASLLWRGKAFPAMSHQLSETGILIELQKPFENPELNYSHGVISFFLPQEGAVSVVGTLVEMAHNQIDFRFIDLPLAQRRLVRKYVSQKSEDEMA